MFQRLPLARGEREATGTGGGVERAREREGSGCVVRARRCAQRDARGARDAKPRTAVASHRGRCSAAARAGRRGGTQAWNAATEAEWSGCNGGRARCPHRAARVMSGCYGGAHERDARRGVAAGRERGARNGADHWDRAGAGTCGERAEGTRRCGGGARRGSDSKEKANASDYANASAA